LEGNNRLVFEGAPLLLGNALEQNDNMTPILWVDGHVYGARVSVGEGSLYILSTPELVKNTAFKELEKAKFLSGILPLFHPPAGQLRLNFSPAPAPSINPSGSFFYPSGYPLLFR
jgi:prepilin-type processing-associated H-X9-DG protein